MMLSDRISSRDRLKMPVSAFRSEDAALIPMFLALPLMYWPKLLEGDTQPWVVIATAIAFLAYWPKSRSAYNKEILVTCGLAVLSLAVYFGRAPYPDALLRYAAMIITFILLWVVFRRATDTRFVFIIRLTIILWFLVGFYQLAAVRLGLPIEFGGRYVASRSGVPSLTAESSFYGTISVLQIMYLITEKDKKNNIYIYIAAASVIISGSAIALLLLSVPLLRLKLNYKLFGIIFLILFIFSGFDIFNSGLFNRFQQFNFSDIGTRFLERDASTNLRVGHIIFTLYENIIDQLFYSSSILFENEYNSWAYNSNIFIYNGSDNILTIAGELIFRSGAIGFTLILTLFLTAWKSASKGYDRIEKLLFLILCLANPLNLSNPFLILYIQKKYQ
jgi:hypothetical protein